ncbi:uncharacterized protein EI97DRAFT_319749 [Westerdykella ornata]|uniref:Uncharacterized protein n=1 Tax=Westerdykella ornata TaxID=318751 RepID=A0A6A6JKE9_WESOR|nr:uncharacterized protein EI97DRAFT_319749 [Westerdykella ornata]KAF2276734.1 hypothetical protein EI97DRAFT_319749 [Westerdykella ornata]
MIPLIEIYYRIYRYFTNGPTLPPMQVQGDSGDYRGIQQQASHAHKCVRTANIETSTPYAYSFSISPLYYIQSIILCVGMCASILQSRMIRHQL